MLARICRHETTNESAISGMTRAATEWMIAELIPICSSTSGGSLS